MNTNWEDTGKYGHVGSNLEHPKEGARIVGYVKDMWEIEFNRQFIDRIEDYPDNKAREELKAFIKDQITKAQREIAEHIINDIPNEIDDEYPNELLHIKDQLRKKYIKKDE